MGYPSWGHIKTELKMAGLEDIQQKLLDKIPEFYITGDSNSIGRIRHLLYGMLHHMGLTGVYRLRTRCQTIQFQMRNFDLEFSSDSDAKIPEELKQIKASIQMIKPQGFEISRVGIGTSVGTGTSGRKKEETVNIMPTEESIAEDDWLTKVVAGDEDALLPIGKCKTESRPDGKVV